MIVAKVISELECYSRMQNWSCTKNMIVIKAITEWIVELFYSEI